MSSGARRPRRAIPVLLLVVPAVLAGGAAAAFWSASGSGTGSASAGTAVAVTLSPGTPAATLFPGGQADVVLTVSNPNVFPVHVGSFALDPAGGTGGLAVDAGHSGCAVAALSFTTQTNGATGWTVPAKAGAVNGSLSVTLPSALAMDVAAANACQGASSTVYLAVGP